MNRNYGIDILRLICCLLVIFLHTDFEGLILYDGISVIARIAVPLFFMITGYFYKKDCDDKKKIKSIVRALILIIVCNCIYFVYGLFINKTSNAEYISSLISFGSIARSLLFNQNLISNHLWYLNAYLYILIIVYILEKIKIFDKIVKLLPYILLLTFIMGPLSEIVLDMSFNYIIYRNFLLIGLPFFAIGYLLKKNPIFVNVNYITLIIAVVISLLELFIYRTKGINNYKDLYITTPFLAVIVFELFLNMKTSNNFISMLGKEYSLYIYIFHPLFRQLSRDIFPGVINTPIRLIFMLTGALIISHFVVTIKRKMQKL